jgi:hypothetical protein
MKVTLKSLDGGRTIVQNATPQIFPIWDKGPNGDIENTLDISLGALHSLIYGKDKNINMNADNRYISQIDPSKIKVDVELVERIGDDCLTDPIVTSSAATPSAVPKDVSSEPDYDD